MGYKTEINYILKASTDFETKEMESSTVVTITKSGFRTFILGAPIMIANHRWEIIGMCIIKESIVSEQTTILKAKIITRFTPDESKIVSQLIQDAEKLK